MRVYVSKRRHGGKSPLRRVSGARLSARPSGAESVVFYVGAAALPACLRVFRLQARLVAGGSGEFQVLPIAVRMAFKAPIRPGSQKLYIL
ncbi:hypothetical protein BSFA1_44010 [Burkholderia sp. SFA1]|nr:hypothetical protein BSFA1_44010 [Burkholderia sp. SFA1]